METGILKALFGLWCVYYATGDLRRSEEITAAIQEQLEDGDHAGGTPQLPFMQRRGVVLSR